ncbi:hypothetical protein [Nostoc sp. UIC 10630]|nr:hypothetical protein [Nostoc sp. UIC 10630]NEU78987.1 hypothetical protein [Nostoc sp. UIC 10630]
MPKTLMIEGKNPHNFVGCAEKGAEGDRHKLETLWNLQKYSFQVST